jgi:hypothetical protein
MNSVGLNSAQPAYSRGESTRARWAVLHWSPLGFEHLKKNHAHYLTKSLTFEKRSLHFNLFTVRSPRRRTTRGRASMNLHWPIHATIDALLWFKPNSSPYECFPSTNFINGTLTRFVHGDSGHHG